MLVHVAASAGLTCRGFVGMRKTKIYIEGSVATAVSVDTFGGFGGGDRIEKVWHLLSRYHSVEESIERVKSCYPGAIVVL